MVPADTARVVPARLTPENRETLAWLQGCLFYDSPRWPLKGSCWWLAWVAGDPVGFAGLSEKRPGVGYLCRAGVLPEWRGRGLQRALIDARVEAARMRGLREVVTDTAAWNTASMNNLIRAGFLAFDPPEPWGVKGAIHWRMSLS